MAQNFEPRGPCRSLFYWRAAGRFSGGWRNGRRARLRTVYPNGYEGSSPSPPKFGRNHHMGLFTSEKSDKVKSKKLKEEGCLVTLSVEIPPVEVENETQNLLVRI